MQIRQAGEADLPELIKITKNVIAQHRELGIEQWDELYPAAEHFLEDIKQRQFFGLYQQNTLIGGYCLNETELPGYETANWQADSFLVIHRLLLEPAYQGKGYARLLMYHAEQIAREAGKKSLRLDCLPQNPAAVALYEKLGYRFCGAALFRKGSFWLYEKVFP